MRVIGYVRVSTDEQQASGLGLEAQESMIRGYCELYGLELVEILSDAASGKNLRRPGFREALGSLRAGQAEGLIVAKLDRLTRSIRDFCRLLDDWFSKDLTLIMVQEQMDTRTANGRMVLNILAAVSQGERELIGERTRHALKAKWRRGEKTGGAVPFGYNLAEEGRLTENRQEQRVMKMIEELRARGWGYRKIAAALNEKGHQTKTGRFWSHVMVGKVVRRIERG